MMIAIAVMLANLTMPLAAQIQQKNGRAQPQAAAPSNDTGPFTPPAGTKIEAVVMAPVQQGAQFAVSPHGVHVATLSKSGSRAVMIYDGVPGPKFDQIFPQSTGVVGVAFSPDGKRYGYCGQSGNEFVVTIDGKEMGRSSETDPQGILSAGSCAIGFTPGSKHAFYTSGVRADANRTAYRVVYDGKVSPIGASSDLRDFTFSPDDNHYTYPWTDPTNIHNQKLIVDGNPAAYFGTEPQWSADSQHLYTKVAAPNRIPAVDVLQDGKPVLRAEGVRLFISPVGSLGVAIVRKAAGLPAATQFLAIGGKMVPGSEITGGGINDVVFSPDGKHYAARYKMANQREYVFADGKRGLDYQSLSSMQAPGVTPRVVAFTADSSKVVYVAANGSGQFLVIGDQEIDLPLNADETVIGPVGSHVATAGQGMVTIDGKVLSFPGISPTTSHANYLKFSPDGSHFAFALTDRGGVTLVLDGVAQSGYGVIADNYVPFMFSADSKHIAYICRPAGLPQSGVCLDGKYVPTGQGQPTSLTFTPDGNHLFWAKRTVGSGFRIFADGKPVLEGTATSSGFAKGTWEMDPSGALLVLLQDAAALKRFSITPSPETGNATLFGGQLGIDAKH
jgi:hypothetical protein